MKTAILLTLASLYLVACDKSAQQCDTECQHQYSDLLASRCVEAGTAAQVTPVGSPESYPTPEEHDAAVQAAADLTARIQADCATANQYVGAVGESQGVESCYCVLRR